MGRPASEGASESAHHDLHDLGPRLEPGLLKACGGRLGDLHWFRSDWQYGGAATAYGAWADDAGRARQVVVKYPISEREYQVLTKLAALDAPTPRVVAHGGRLGDEAIDWVVMERLPGNPAAAHLHKEVVPHLIEAAARFYKAGDGRIDVDPPAKKPDWHALLERAREAIHDNPQIPHAANWAAAVRHVMKSLPRLLAIWESRTMNAVCHGDLHPGNCMERPAGSPWGPPAYVLFDFAETHRGHWVEDAVYLERMYWARPQVLDGIKPVSWIAKARRALGLDATDDYALLADVRRVLMAATSPAFLETEGSRAYMNAAIEVLERTLAQTKL